MPNQNKTAFSIRTIAFIGVLAAMIYVATLLRIPFLGSKVHFANALCLLSGMLLGPIPGGFAAGLGSALYDMIAGGYDALGIAITFVSKFAMALVCGLLMPRGDKRDAFLPVRTVLAAIAGALTYVALYMLKTFLYELYIYLHPMEAVGPVMVSKLIPSLINALFAVIAAPLLYHALLPAVRALHIREDARTNR